MPAKRGKGGRGGVMGTLGQGIWLIVVAGLILGFLRVNDLTTPAKVYDYFKSWSDAADECVGEDPLKTRLKDCSTGTGSPDEPEVIPPGSGGGLGDSPIVISETKKDLLNVLTNVPVVEAPEAPYNREEWKHWSDFDKDGCDTREEILVAQGKDVKTGDYCKILSGTWVDPYSGKTMTDSSTIDIDHVLPLGWVADHGGADWPASMKEQYANDPAILIISSATENRKKSDRGPSEYMPPRAEFHCAYAGIWIKGVQKYKLSVSQEDKQTLAQALESCK